MKLRRTVACLAATLALSFAPGCARSRGISNTIDAAPESSFAGHGVEALERADYEVLGQAQGSDASSSWFVLWFPVGGIRTKNEIIDAAYFDAVESMPGCDALLIPRVKSRRIVIPLLLVNVVIKRNELKGRCVRILGDQERGVERGAALRPDEARFEAPQAPPAPR